MAMPKRLITGLTPQREQQYQERQMLRIARGYEAPIRREVLRAMREIANGDEEAQQRHERRMNTIIQSLYRDSFKFFGNRLWQATQKASQPTEQKRDVPLTPQFDLARRLWIQANAAYKVTEIAGTTLAQAQEVIRQATADAVELGLDEIQTAALIQQRVTELGGELSRLRSRVISRTESHAASNASNQMAAKSSGLPFNKEWIASGGERTRHTHRLVNGKTVEIDQPFEVPREDGGFDTMMQPGDSNGSAGNVINCRCVLGYSLP